MHTDKMESGFEKKKKMEEEAHIYTSERLGNRKENSGFDSSASRDAV